MNKNLNIITLNIPFPPDYGGMIDSFYRIRTLSSMGVHIHLHCFEYGRAHSKELESFCETVSYYPRKSGLLQQFSLLPYIVASRRSAKLLESLKTNDYPILFDGLHSSYYIDHPSLSKRKKIVRLHNIEHNYYSTLARFEPNLIKKMYFQSESYKLRMYETVLCKADYLLPISDADQAYIKEKFNNSVYLPPSHPFTEPDIKTGFGEYIIYHGDLSIQENVSIALFLISEVFPVISCKCIIAGKNPPAKVISRAMQYSNIEVVPNPDNNKMSELISNAHINLLPALASNGFKLKILIALFSGRHCLINSVVAKNTSLRSLCHVGDSYEEIIRIIHSLMQERFTENMIIERKKILSDRWNNNINGEKLIELIFTG